MALTPTFGGSVAATQSSSSSFHISSCGEADYQYFAPVVNTQSDPPRRGGEGLMANWPIIGLVQ